MNNPTLQQAVLDSVTAALGAVVRKRPDDGWAGWQTIGLPHCALWLSYQADRKGDRLHVSVDWPRDGAGCMVTGRDAEYKASNPEISVAASKPAAVIAADITRRLLPEAKRLYALAANICESRNSYARNVAANWEALGLAAGVPARGDHGRKSIYPLPEGVRITHVGDDGVRLELDLTVGQACQIIADRATTPKETV